MIDAASRRDAARDAQMQGAVPAGHDSFDRGGVAGDHDRIVGAGLVPVVKKGRKRALDFRLPHYARAGRELQDRIVSIERHQPVEIPPVDRGEVGGQHAPERATRGGGETSGRRAGGAESLVARSSTHPSPVTSHECKTRSTAYTSGTLPSFCISACSRPTLRISSTSVMVPALSLRTRALTERT